MVRKIFLFQFKPDTRTDEISSLLKKWQEITSLSNISEVEIGEQNNKNLYKHQFTHAVIATLKSEDDATSFFASNVYTEIASKMNAIISQVIIFDMTVEDKYSPNNKKEPVPTRDQIQIGQTVWAVEKKNYKTGKLTSGTVAKILTSKRNHPRGIKVKLDDGTVARVQKLNH